MIRTTYVLYGIDYTTLDFSDDKTKKVIRKINQLLHRGRFVTVIWMAHHFNKIKDCVIPYFINSKKIHYYINTPTMLQNVLKEEHFDAVYVTGFAKDYDLVELVDTIKEVNTQICISLPHIHIQQNEPDVIEDCIQAGAVISEL